MALKTHLFAGTDAANDTTDTNKPPPAITHYPTIAAGRNISHSRTLPKRPRECRMLKINFTFDLLSQSS